MTIVTLLRGCSDSQIFDIYKKYSAPLKQAEYIKKITELGENNSAEINLIIKELTIAVNRYLFKYPTANIDKKLLRDSFVNYLYAKLYTPQVNRDWNPKAKIIVQDAIARERPTLDNLWDINYNGT